MSGLPRVKIIFENGLIGSTEASDDAVVGLVATGVAVTGKFALGTAYLITTLDGLEDLGITSESTDLNANIYKTVKEFYTEAPAGTKLWILAAADSVKASELCDKDKAYAKTLIEAANGAINFFMVATKDASSYTATIKEALDEDVYTAITNAQALCEWAADTKFAPCFALLEGRHYSGTVSLLANLSERSDNRVAVVIGDTVSASTGASVGLVAGRYAAIPVQRSAARVKTGALGVDDLYIGSKVAELGDPDLIHDARFITFRTLIGKAGYFISDDKLATAVSDDYALIPRRRVIDKAFRIGYQTLVEELGEEIPVTDDGNIPASIVKSIQNTVEVAIENAMTAYGNLGVDTSDANDTGVECYIDYNQDVVSSSTLNVKLRVKPYGYAKYINLYLGFKTTTV